jgi:NAD(P)H-hydrate epimerase
MFMNLRPLTRDEVRGVDTFAINDLGIPGVVLMENAGRGAVEVLERLGIPDKPVVIVAGKGNNGGDGFVMARHLEYRGYAVRVLLIADSNQLGGDAQTNWRILERSAIPTTVLGASPDLETLDSTLAGAGWIVDGLLGTGARGSLRDPYPAVIERLNRQRTPILAIDLPSGLDCDTGQPLGVCVRATHTVTFVAPKRGFAKPGAAQFTGEVHVADIGIPRRALHAYLERRGV